MKRFVFVLAFLLVSIFVTEKIHAQGLGGGISAGVNFSQVDGDSYGGYEKIGYHFGGFAWYDFSDKFSIQPEILFNGRGSRNAKFGYRFGFHYIDLPLFLNYRIWGDPESTSIQIQAAPMVGVLLSANEGYGTVKSDVTNNYNRVDLGWQVGATFKASKNVGFFGRFGLSAIDIRKSRFPYTVHRYFTFGGRVFFK